LTRIVQNWSNPLTFSETKRRQLGASRAMRVVARVVRYAAFPARVPKGRPTHAAKPGHPKLRSHGYGNQEEDQDRQEIAQGQEGVEGAQRLGRLGFQNLTRKAGPLAANQRAGLFFFDLPLAY
jgi:hypothetical protein